VTGRSRLLVIGASLILVAGGLGVATVLTRPASHRTHVPPATGPASAAAVARLHAVQGLLHRRSVAVVHRDRAAFMATIDPKAKRFRSSEARMFAALAPVPIASWSYAMTATARRPPPDASRYHSAIWAPSYFALHYQLTGFDPKPTTLQQYPTFVERRGRWYLASLTDYARRGLVSATDIWNYGPVKVLRRHDLLVLGAPSQLGTMTQVAREAETAIGQVTAVWGRHWARRAVILVPATMHEMALIDDYKGDLSTLAALTSAEVSTAAGAPAPVGDRITINPANWPKLSAVGASIVVRHELTHVATRAVTGTRTPTWLAEGFADYVGFLDAPVSVDLAGAELKRLVDAGQSPKALPTNRDFRSSNAQLAAHYEAAWLACRYIAGRFGQPALVRFYRAVGTSPLQPPVALATALRDVLHLRVRQFTARWRHYVVTELA
jgi:hypothetical protein